MNDLDKIKLIADIASDTGGELLEHILENEEDFSKIREELEELKGREDYDDTELREKIEEALQAIDDIELLEPERGNRFIGKFPTVSELPVIDDINVKEGDWAFIEDSGEIWYA